MVIGNSPCDRAIQYARDVNDKKIIVGPYVRLACQRFLNDLARSEKSDYPYIFDRAKAERYVQFVQLLPHVKGVWAGRQQNLILEPWQLFIECNLFGWIHKETRRRRFRQAYEEEPRKNSKSTKLAARGLYMLSADGETGAEIYSGATTEKQALEVYRPAWQMMRKLPRLQQMTGVEMAGNANNPGPMYIPRDMSRFETIIGKPGDGASPHAALIDEYHEHDSDHMVDTMQTGMGAREQPMLSIITTAGSNLGGPCYAKRRDIISILEGTEEDETTFGIIYSLDPGDAWDDPANLIKANPNYNISVFPEFLESQLAQARRSASKQNAFRTKHLNEWVGARTAWMNMLAWQRQKRKLNLTDFKGCRAWLAVDLASKLDVAALVLLIQKGKEYFCIPRLYVPEKTVEENEKYREYVTAGDLIATPGMMTDYEFLEEEIFRLSKCVALQDISFDPAQASYMITRLEKSALKVIEYRQSVSTMSEPMKEVEGCVLSGTLFHDGNQAMTWMVGNVVAHRDAKDHIYPRKEDNYDEKCKIDGPVALIMAMGRALLMKQQPTYKLYFV